MNTPKLLEAGYQHERTITVRETWIKIDGIVYKFWNKVLVGQWPEAEAPFTFPKGAIG